MTAGRTVAIVQARMGSTRLPGKVLKDIGGESMLGRVLGRLSLAQNLDEVVVATSDLERDDVIETEVEQSGYPLTRGSEEDVLDRYRQAVLEHDAETVARVTSDCPLIDPGIVDETVQRYRRTSADYASNTLEPRTFPRGLDVEVFSRKALEITWEEDGDPARREHVTPYIKQNPDCFEQAVVRHEQDLSHHRWTVDEAPDLQLIREIYDRLPSPDASWTKVLELVRENPELTEINAEIQQKDNV